MPKPINPYTPHKVASAGLFAGRSEEIAIIRRMLNEIRCGGSRNFAVTGERGIGKSSLMSRVREIALVPDDEVSNSKGLLVCEIDLDERDDYDSMLGKLDYELRNQIDKVDVARSVFKKLWRFLTRWEVFGVKYERDPSESVTVEYFVKVLAAAVRRTRTSHGGILILIDEADTPPAEAGFGLLMKRIIGRLPKEGCQHVGFGIAGQTRLLERLRIGHKSSLRSFWICHLRPLTESECRRVVRAGISAANKDGERMTMDTSAEDWIVDNSEGYPHFLQQYCYAAFDANADDHIDLRDAWNGAFGEHGAIAQLGASYFEGMYLSDEVSDTERQVLSTLAENDSAFTSLSEIVADCSDNEETVKRALSRLLDREIIQHDPIKMETYRIILRSFASWIRVRLRGSI